MQDVICLQDVMFVLDNSGSMSQGRLQTCKTCLLRQIFPKCLGAQDRVGLIVFDHTINVDIDLGLWQGSHQSQMIHTLSGVQAQGGTEMWTALDHAISRLSTRLSSEESTRTKWIVALTDGSSSGSPAQFNMAARLRTGIGASIRFLFITVGLADPHRKIISDTCMRLHTDPERKVLGDEMFTANGSQDALVKAWKDVGEMLTVSQHIEKQGELITPGEAQRLLRKHMKLDSSHRNWSRLKQVHWIRYLFRRCGILAASETFNKNQDKPNFGSTTVKIMLDEATLPS